MFCVFACFNSPVADCGLDVAMLLELQCCAALLSAWHLLQIPCAATFRTDIELCRQMA